MSPPPRPSPRAGGVARAARARDPSAVTPGTTKRPSCTRFRRAHDARRGIRRVRSLSRKTNRRVAYRRTFGGTRSPCTKPGRVQPCHLRSERAQQRHASPAAAAASGPASRATRPSRSSPPASAVTSSPAPSRQPTSSARGAAKLRRLERAPHDERPPCAPARRRRIALHEDDALPRLDPLGPRVTRAPPRAARVRREARRNVQRRLGQPAPPAGLAPATIGHAATSGRADSSTCSARIAVHADPADRTVPQEARRAGRRSFDHHPLPSERRRAIRAGGAPQRHHGRADRGGQVQRAGVRAEGERATAEHGDQLPQRRASDQVAHRRPAGAGHRGPERRVRACAEQHRAAPGAAGEAVHHRRRPVGEPAPRRTRRADANPDHRPAKPGEQRLPMRRFRRRRGEPELDGYGRAAEEIAESEELLELRRGSTPCGGSRRVATSQAPSRASVRAKPSRSGAPLASASSALLRRDRDRAPRPSARRRSRATNDASAPSPSRRRRTRISSSHGWPVEHGRRRRLDDPTDVSRRQPAPQATKQRQRADHVTDARRAGRSGRARSSSAAA